MAAHQVHHAADRADHDLRALLQPRRLVADRRAAEHGHDLDALLLAVGAQRLGHLDAQLARRRQDERLHLGVVGVDVLEQRQPERGRLAGAGLRLADHVAALEQRRDGLLLDRGRAPRSPRCSSASSERLGEPEFAKVAIVRSGYERVEQQLAAACAGLRGPRGRGDLGQRIGRRRPAARSSPRAARSNRSAQRLAHHVRAGRGSASARSRPPPGSSSAGGRVRDLVLLAASRSRRPRSGRTARARRGSASKTRAAGDLEAPRRPASPPLASSSALRQVLRGRVDRGVGAQLERQRALLLRARAVAITRPAPIGFAELDGQAAHAAGARSARPRSRPAATSPQVRYRCHAVRPWISSASAAPSSSPSGSGKVVLGGRPRTPRNRPCRSSPPPAALEPPPSRTADHLAAGHQRQLVAARCSAFSRWCVSAKLIPARATSISTSPSAGLRAPAPPRPRAPPGPPNSSI